MKIDNLTALCQENKMKAFLIIDSKGEFCGIHKHIQGAKHHLFQRRKFFKTTQLRIEEVEIKFINSLAPVQLDNRK
jgi:hypothetical protein